MKENCQKGFKMLTSFFLSNWVPFNGRDYEKQKGPRNSDQPLIRLQNKFRKIPLLVMYYLPSLMIWYKAVFELFRKLHLIIYACQFMASKIIQLSFVLLNLESVERKENFTKLRYAGYEKSFLDKIKNIFYSFRRANIG